MFAKIAGNGLGHGRIDTLLSSTDEVLVELNEGSGTLDVLPPEYLSLDEVRERLGVLVLDELGVRDAEDGIEFLECVLGRLGNEEVDQDKGDGVETSVEAESSSRAHGVQHTRERDTKDGSPEETGGDSPSHTLLSLSKREDFSRVCKRHRTFANGIEDRKQIDEEGNKTDADLVGLTRDQEA